MRVYTGLGQLTIDSIVMVEARWQVINLHELWLPSNVRGSDRVLPGVPGVIPYRRRRTVTERTLEMYIDGRVNEEDEVICDGASAAAWAGLESHIKYLRQYVVDPTNIGDGTRTAVLTYPSGTTATGQIHVLGLTLGSVRNGRAAAAMTISIPNGVL